MIMIMIIMIMIIIMVVVVVVVIVIIIIIIIIIHLLLLPLLEPQHWLSYSTVSLALWLTRPPRERQTQGSIPACAGIFRGQVIPVTLKLALQWLPCQAPGVIGSALGLVGSVSVYCDWMR